MPSYSYKGIAANGRSSSGTVEAESPRAARARLKEKDIFVSKIEPCGSTFAPALRSRSRVGNAELSRTLKQLATLLTAGVPLVEAVRSLLNRRPRARMAAALSEMHGHLRAGGSLESAMAQHPGVFPSMYIGMVRAGESSGSLDSALDRIADHAQAAARLQARIRTAMTYPAIMAVVGTSIVAFLLAYVVPQVTRVFLEANQTLPLPTRALMGLGQGLARWGLEILLLTATAAFAARALWKSEKGHRRLEGMLYALPLLGGFCRDIETARFTHTLSTMVAGGMSIVDGLDVALSVCPKGLFADAIEETRNGVSEGASLASALERSGLFNPTAIDMIVVGERSGELESMLSKASQALEEEVREQIEAMASLLEPAMILLMAAVVLFVVLAILLPVFEMNQLVG